MNQITVAGNLAKQAEVRFLPNGDPVANFTVADNMGKDKGAIFWNCQLFIYRVERNAEWLKIAEDEVTTFLVEMQDKVKTLKTIIGE